MLTFNDIVCSTGVEHGVAMVTASSLHPRFGAGLWFNLQKIRIMIAVNCDYVGFTCYIIRVEK